MTAVTRASVGRTAAVRLLVGSAFFVSGAAALVYQVAWQRILALQSGVGIYSVAMIVGAFMAGLGLGSRWGGLMSARLDPSQALRRFVMVELAIAAFGAVSCRFYYNVLYARGAFLYAEPWRAGVLHFLALFAPTVLMGTSLPLLSRAMVRDGASAGRTIGLLYGVNMLGAGAGALLTPWVLIRYWGIRGAVFAAAAGNTSTVILTALAAGLLSRIVVVEAPVRDEGAERERARHPFSLWVALYAASGFCALSLEIVWFRLVDVVVRSKAQTFGTVLAVYLAGSALGCLGASLGLRRLRRPLRAFLLCQCGLLLYAGLTATLLVHAPLARWFGNAWLAGHGLAVFTAPWKDVLRLYAGVPLVLFGPATVLMGLSFPILQLAVQDDPRTSGRKVGLLQAANIAGCVAGSLLVGLLVLDWVGSSGTLRLLLAIGVGFAALGVRSYGWRSPFPAALALLAAGLFALPGQQALLSRLHGTSDPQALVREDATGVGALVRRGVRWTVYVDGKSHSWIPFGGVHTVLGAAPAVVHPAPVDVAIIGLGSGDTSWAAGCRPETRSVTVFEISGPQPRLLRDLASRYDIPDLRSFLADPRVHLVTADGRHAIMQSERRYDIIEADGLLPDVAYSGNLYSRQFFEWCARRLKPNGIACTWAPTPRVYATFTSVFPYVLGADRERGILLGSREPIAVDRAAWQARLDSVAGYLRGRRAKEVGALLERLGPWTDPVATSVDDDLFPRDEFLTPPLYR